MEKLKPHDNVFFHIGDVQKLYAKWPTPTAIVSDGPYGVGGYPGDPKSVKGLPDAYTPHLAAWEKAAKPFTTLWFWNTELGWATMHPYLLASGWEYRALNIWDKGIAHAAGNTNGKTMRKFPVVTEVCAHYVRQPAFNKMDGKSAQEWMREEWRRTGMPMSKANDACGVRNAASRKYLTGDHLWYFPPHAVFRQMRDYANKHGDPKGKPYFQLADEPADDKGWERIWHIFNFEYGVSNVWQEPALRGTERMKTDGKVIHLNQKPLKLMERIVAASSNPGDVIWEPFGGLASASIVAAKLGRIAYVAEINTDYAPVAIARIRANTQK